MDTEPPAPDDSTPPESNAEEPVQAVPTRETTPIWAQTSPAAPAQKKGDPDWSKTETSSNGDSKKAAPAWAQTVPTSPGAEIEEPADAEPGAAEATDAEQGAAEPTEAESDAVEPAAAEATAQPAAAASTPPATDPPTVRPLTDPPKAIAADAMKSTWPPASSSTPAPPEETDIWPPEPPTETAMPAWPPPSELDEPATPAQAIPSWPDSFDPMPAASAAPTMPPATGGAPAPSTIPPAVVEAPMPPTIPPAVVEAPIPPTITPAPKPAPKPAAKPPDPPVEPEWTGTEAPAAASPPASPGKVMPQPEPVPAQPGPVAPPQSGPPGRPGWAPGPVAEPRPASPQDPSGAPVHLPAWAPRVPLAGDTGKPTWFSPKEAIPHATAQPAAQSVPPPPVAPTPPLVGGQLPVAPIPPAPVAAAPGQPSTSKSTWEVVEQQRKSAPHAKVGPTAEDRSYAEWFSWAKRGGAPASACHAAAQGAFKALSGGKDVNTAVQWATAAMSRPPEPVSQARQAYCAWFALANIDLNLDQHKAHLFAAGAIQALDNGQDASAAHAAGLAAAGIR